MTKLSQAQRNVLQMMMEGVALSYCGHWVLGGRRLQGATPTVLERTGLIARRAGQLAFQYSYDYGLTQLGWEALKK